MRSLAYALPVHAGLGERFRFARVSAGYTLRGVQAACGYSFVHLSALENGRKAGISLEWATTLADLYGVSLEWLATGRTIT